MRRIKSSGLAGVPGVVLTQRDRRHLASRLRAEGSSLNGLGSGSDCADCGPGSLDRDLALEVVKKLGSPELTAAAQSSGHSRFVTDAARLAAATREAMKFRRGEFAVLSGITSPAFAVLAGKTAKSLRKKVPDPEYAAVLLLFITGAVDTAAGRGTFLARDFQKAQRDLDEAFSQVPSSHLAGIVTSGVQEADGVQSIAVWNLNGLGASPTLGAPPAPATSDPRRFWPETRKKDLKDLGTSTKAPDALDFVPFDLTLKLLVKAGAAEGNKAAGKLRAWAKANPLPTSDARVEAAAQRAAAWIIRTAPDSALKAQDRWGLNAAGEFLGNTGWLALAYRYGATVPNREKSASAFEKHVAKMLSMAAKQCVQRTGQTGKTDSDGRWIASASSTSERVPPGTEAARYVGTWDKISVDPKIRPEAVLFSQYAYQLAYRKEPTLQALNWYGSFGYGLDMGPGRAFASYLTGFYVQSQRQLDLYATRVGELESVREAGAVPPPQDVQNNTNVFMSVFNAMGPAMSVVMDAINQSIKVATDTLCFIFRLLMGPEVGGIFCGVFAALLKLIGGITKGAVGVLFSVGKALLGFIGKLAAGDWLGALYELFVGVNTAVIYALGGPIADFIGIPFTKADERGDKTSPDFVPSMERMGETLTKKNPLFLVMLTLNVLSLIFAPTPQNAGALMITLSPILAMVMAPAVGRSLRATKDKWLEKYRTLVNEDIERALMGLNKVIAGVIVGFMTIGDAMKIFADRMAKFAEKEGGTGPATVKTLQFFINNLQGRLISVTAGITSMMQMKEGFEFKVLLDDLVGLTTDFLVLIPAFAVETGVFDKDSMESVSVIAVTGAATVEQAYESYNEIVRTLDSKARANVAAQIAADGERAAKSSGEVQKYTAPKDIKTKAAIPIGPVIALGAVGALAIFLAITDKRGA